MSRDLVSFDRRARDAKNKDKVDTLVSDMGCSEPVARNFLKYQRFGMGPLASVEAERARNAQQKQRERMEKAIQDAPSSASESTVDKLRRVRELEKRLKEQKEQEEQELLDYEEEKKKKKATKRAGLAPLGAVMPREEKVDPWAKAPVDRDTADPEPAAGDDEENGRAASDEAMRISQEELRKRKQLEEAVKLKQKDKVEDRFRPQASKGKKKRKGKDQQESSEDSEKPGRKRGRSESDSPERKATGLMSEKEIVKMMRKEAPKDKPARGSLQAKQRIQRELQEWTTTKAGNEEFWKAPKFALCYSAETSRTLRGNTGPSSREGHHGSGASKS